MGGGHEQLRITWYRSPLSRQELRVLNQRSDSNGFLQTGRYLGLLALTGLSVCLAAGHLPWPVVALILFVHGTCWAFLINGFHELVHGSVFKTKFLNEFFARVFGFLGWYNPHLFWASHTEHHKYTLHPPDDLEVVLPAKLTLNEFLQCAFIDLRGLCRTVSKTVRLARGKVNGQWENALFPKSAVKERQRLFSWARVLLAGHATIIIVSVLMRWWLLPVVITVAPFYGAWLNYLCNNSQHAGLEDNVPDFRLCCRTITLNPFLRFLYWQMNYHTEHHMYAAVPCYNLGKLHALIKRDLPECPHGLLETWKQISMIMKKQKSDPTYQYAPELPSRFVGTASYGMQEIPSSALLPSRKN